MQDSGEGRWTIQTAIEEEVPAPVLVESLFARFRSRQDHAFGDKLLSAMREQFGGHAEPPRRVSGQSKLRNGSNKRRRSMATLVPREAEIRGPAEAASGGSVRDGDLRRGRRSHQA